jgi:hypothetical protein
MFIASVGLFEIRVPRKPVGYLVNSDVNASWTG